eukprot:TRINITY_DN79340_c0_g1_i1.p1 TRINITY_DN79340_c0_g1~~TRINITY_DN79340_c0_g1_i1.p1  ORF type:complete len:508 (+),score=68.73 TRINITY_DN79340_c0_g1_i1:200-1723(+)
MAVPSNLHHRSSQASDNHANASSSEAKSNNELPTLAELVDDIGVGWSQMQYAFLGGGVWLADGAELLLISSVAKAVTKEWHLSLMTQGFIVTLVFCGILVGNLSSGPLSDRFGRREMILVSYVGIFGFSIMSSLAGTVVELAMWRVLVGTSIGVGQPSWLSVCAEITPSTWRMVMGSATQSLFIFGEIYSAFLLMADDPSLKHLHWRSLLQLGAIPAAILAVTGFLFLWESPTYLALKGRHAEAKKVLQVMCKKNGVEDLSVDYKQVQVPQRVGEEDSFVALFERQGKVVFGRRLWVQTLVTAYSCFVLNLSYYGCLYAFPQVLPSLVEHGAAASALLVGALWEIPGMVLGAVVGVTMQRKTGLKFFLIFLIVFLLLFVIGANNHGKHWATYVILRIGYYGTKAFPGVGFVLVYQIATEIYPAEVRTSGSAFCLACGRTAAMFSPMIYEAIVGTFGNFLAFFLLIASMCLLNLYLVDLLHETAHLKLDDQHIEDHHEDDPEQTRTVN